MRKQMGYPPYTTLIKVSTVGTEKEVNERMRYVETLLAPSHFVTYDRLLRAPGGKVLLHGFLRLVRDEWPNDELVAKLRSLPPIYTVAVDPDSIL
jgi:hypothetical protein